jgi:hypothetical protein
MTDGRPRAWNYYLAPLGRRPEWERRGVADYGHAPPGLAGLVPGVPAYEAGQGGTTVAVSVPADYLWNGTGAVPSALGDLADAVAHLFGAKMGPRSDPKGYAETLQQLYAALGECGETYAQITQAIAWGVDDKLHDADTATKIAWAIQGDIIGRNNAACLAAIKNMIPPLALVPMGAPTQPPGGSEPPLLVKAGAPPPPPAATPLPWGWIVGGVGVLAIVGVAVYFGTRKPRRKNPRRANPCGSCATANPAPMEWIDTTGEDVTDAAPRRRNPRRSSKRRPGRSKGKLPRRRNEYGGTFGFPSVQPDVMQLQAPVMMPILGNPKRTLAAELEKFARETAADTGGTYQDAVRAMRDEPGEVAANLRAAGYRVTTAAVIRWTETPKKANPPRRSNTRFTHEAGTPAAYTTEPRIVRLEDAGRLIGWEIYSTRGDGSERIFHGLQPNLRAAQEWALSNLNVGRFDTGTAGGGRKRRNPKARSAGKRAR